MNPGERPQGSQTLPALQAENPRADLKIGHYTGERAKKRSEDRPVHSEGNGGSLSACNLLTTFFSTLARGAFLTPVPSTHAHLYHSRAPTNPAVATHTDLVLLNSFFCNTCAEN